MLDNAGLELYTDLVLADVLVSEGLAPDGVVLHGKQLPWFVSDTLRSDLNAVVAACEAPAPPVGSDAVTREFVFCCVLFLLLSK